MSVPHFLFLSRAGLIRASSRLLVRITAIKCAFVLQWPGSSTNDYDSTSAIENLLISSLSKSSKVDGHDVGSGETNIFIETDDPQKLYEEIISVLGSHDAWPDIRFAYRNVDEDAYTVLWPTNLRDFEVR